VAEDQADKTESATPKRREEARKSGEVAQSREIQSVVILATALGVAVSFMGVRLVKSFAEVAQAAWGGLATPPASLADYQAWILEAGHVAGIALLPILLLMAVMGTVSQIAQTGPLLSLEAMEWKGSRLDPLSGLKRLVSGDRLFDLVKSLFKVGIVGFLVWYVLHDRIALLTGLSGADIGDALIALGRSARSLAIAILLALGAMAILDLIYQRYSWEKKHRMSKREVRDEMKDREGDPHVRARFRQMQREVSRSRMIGAVADADVVVTNPTHYAVALKYDREQMVAPKVVAKGRNHVAQRIKEEARKNGVPVLENPPLARMLHKATEVGREVPANLFQAVAEVLAYVYRLDPRKGRAWSGAR